MFSCTSRYQKGPFPEERSFRYEVLRLLQIDVHAEPLDDDTPLCIQYHPLPFL